MRILLCLMAAGCAAAAAEHQGAVRFNGQPVPGAEVTATRGAQRATTITDPQGAYRFRDLAESVWRMEVAMPCFVPLTRDVAIAVGAPQAEWNLQAVPVDQPVTAAVTPPPAAPPPAVKLTRPQVEAAPPAELAQDASDAFAISGSVNNGAVSPLAQNPAFGNNRKNTRGLYNGGIGLAFDSSWWDARPYSITGQDTPQPAYRHLTASASFGGPVVRGRYPLNLTVVYQGSWNRNASIQQGLMPTLAERAGDLAGTATDPLGAAPFSGNVIPASRISPQAVVLLQLYPLPNFAQNGRYNFQAPLLRRNTQQNLQSRLDRTLNSQDQIGGSLSYQQSDSSGPNLFGFVDPTRTSGVSTSVNVSHRFSPRKFLRLGFQFSTAVTSTTPYFANGRNVSGDAGIFGNNQDPVNWGPPQLGFAAGIASLTDGTASSVRNQTSGVSADGYWNRRGHNFKAGGVFRRQQRNSLGQQNPRGSFFFTGAATGLDFADFLLGIPDTSSIAYGNADKYYRGSVAAAYVSDDWRVSSGLTVNGALRWEYSSPVTERYGRLVNLAISPGFTSAVPVVASETQGPLLRPARRGIEPRLGISWRPVAASSLVIRGGYGLYRDTAVYPAIVSRLAQQAPLSMSLRIANSPANPLTLANGFTAPATGLFNTFAVDPDFRIGYAQNWDLAVQHDLPFAMIATATYLGIKGTRAQQEFLPNTYPVGAANPCPACPAGFTFLTSNGNSTRQAAQVQLRRRSRHGFSASGQYTFSKALDDASLGGRGGSSTLIAQNWLDLSAERARSNFDQRHVLTVEAQFNTGVRIARPLREWTLTSQLTAGSGLPLTPVYIAAVSGTGVTGSIRPQYTGAPLYSAPAGLSLNPAAYAPPPAGQWGNAGRDSINGPQQFALSGSLSRVFRLGDRLNADLRIDGRNPLNHVVYTSWNTNINSTQFGLPVSANAMRSLQASLRVRF